MATLCFCQMALSGAHLGSSPSRLELGLEVALPFLDQEGQLWGLLSTCGHEPSCAAWPAPVLMLSQDRL